MSWEGEREFLRILEMRRGKKKGKKRREEKEAPLTNIIGWRDFRIIPLPPPGLRFRQIQGNFDEAPGQKIRCNLMGRGGGGRIGGDLTAMTCGRIGSE